MPNKIPEAICFTDGASRGNPGEAAIGVVIIHTSTKKKHTFSKYLGNKLTNNYAEYSAVLFCLERLVESGIRSFELRADSQLLVQQINGKYKVSSKNIIPLYQEVVELLKNFKEYDFVHVPRAENRMADALANEALDREVERRNSKEKEN